jgi:organic radical activating enzyme
MKYKVSEIFSSIQGEGAWMGFPVTFVRLAGCNMNCSFCDTPQRNKANMVISAGEIIKRIDDYDPVRIIITGGEPLMQDAGSLSMAIADEGYIVGLETNGTIQLPRRHAFDHVSLSPKTKIDDIKIKPIETDSLKLLFPYLHEPIHCWDKWAGDYIDWKGIQPIDGIKDSLRGATNEARRIGNDWRLSVQLHKLIGVQ